MPAYPYSLVAVPGLAASLVPGGVLLSWETYAAADQAGHQPVGYRIYRNSVASSPGSVVADETSGLTSSARSFVDSSVPPTWTQAYYTLVAVEPIDFGARPYGEGGNAPYGV